MLIMLYLWTCGSAIILVQLPGTFSPLRQIKRSFLSNLKLSNMENTPKKFLEVDIGMSLSVHPSVSSSVTMKWSLCISWQTAERIDLKHGCRNIHYGIFQAWLAQLLIMLTEFLLFCGLCLVRQFLCICRQTADWIKLKFGGPTHYRCPPVWLTFGHTLLNPSSDPTLISPQAGDVHPLMSCCLRNTLHLLLCLHCYCHIVYHCWCLYSLLCSYPGVCCMATTPLKFTWLPSSRFSSLRSVAVGTPFIKSFWAHNSNPAQICVALIWAELPWHLQTCGMFAYDM